MSKNCFLISCCDTTSSFCSDTTEDIHFSLFPISLTRRNTDSAILIFRWTFQSFCGIVCSYKEVHQMPQQTIRKSNTKEKSGLLSDFLSDFKPLFFIKEGTCEFYTNPFLNCRVVNSLKRD